MYLQMYPLTCTYCSSLKTFVFNGFYFREIVNGRYFHYQNKNFFSLSSHTFGSNMHRHGQLYISNKLFIKNDLFFRLTDNDRSGE